MAAACAVVDPAYVLRAARTFLSVVHPVDGEGGVTELADEERWEASGCLLWDIAAIPEQTELLAANNIQEILQVGGGHPLPGLFRGFAWDSRAFWVFLCQQQTGKRREGRERQSRTVDTCNGRLG